jgi:tellurite resistance protein TerC
MGLRSLYFTIKESMKSLKFLNYGLGIILAFVAFKLLAAKFVHIPVFASLLVIVGVLAVTVILSLVFKDKDPETPESQV